MIARDSWKRTGGANLSNDLVQPEAVGLVVFDTTHLFARIDDKSVGHSDLHLVLDEGAIREILDHVVRVHSTLCW